MVQSDPDIKISSLEKLLVNWPTLLLTLYNTAKAEFGMNEYSGQSIPERFHSIWNDKIRKYRKLLTVQELHGGMIPPRIEELQKKTKCGYTRLIIARYHNYLSRF